MNSQIQRDLWQITPSNAASLIESRAIGCLLGQVIGDALGTRYEFETSENVRAQITEDLQNPSCQHGILPILGEGPFNLIPGFHT